MQVSAGSSFSGKSVPRHVSEVVMQVNQEGMLKTIGHPKMSPPPSSCLLLVGVEEA